MKRILITLALAACGHAPTTTTSTNAPPPPPAGPKIDGSEGAVCSWGGREPRPDPQPAACKPGLQCCLPCGIGGCDSICEAVTDCPELP